MGERQRRYAQPKKQQRRSGRTTLPNGLPTIATVKERVTITALLERLGAPNVPRKSGWAAMRCPFHDDKNASGQVNAETGYFVCFACEARGDVIGLAARHIGTGDVKEALKWLAENFRM